MADRATELRELAAELTAHDAVNDAFVAKSFTDRLVAVDCAADAELPEEIKAMLHDHDCYGANSVYATTESDRSFSGAVGEKTRHQFVDVETRGDHQSYVVD